MLCFGVLHKMKKTEKGTIIFNDYVVKYIRFTANTNYDNSEVSISFKVGSNVKVSDDKTHMNVELQLDIFKDAVENNYPFEMYLAIEGRFVINTDEEDAIEKYKPNALAILYPYARAIVSTYTAGANIAPLILPTVNINKLLKQ